MNPLLLMLLTFVAVVVAVLAVYSVLADLFLRDRSSFSKRVADEFRKRQRDHARKSSLFKDLGAAATETLAGEERPSTRRRFAEMVEQSGLNLTPERLLGIMVGVGAGLGVLGFLIRAIPGGLVGAA